jgi:hypothetical protein
MVVIINWPLIIGALGVIGDIAAIWITIAWMAYGWRPFRGMSVTILPSTPGKLIGKITVAGTRTRRCDGQ